MNAITIQMLSAQYWHELSNSVKYQRLANLFTFNGLTGIKKFLCNQAKGEYDHAQKIISHIDDMIISLEPGSVDINITSNIESGLLDIFAEILTIEQNTTEKLKDLNAQAVASGDTLTSQWLYDTTGLLKEQIEEERTIKTIVARIENRMQANSDLGGIMYDIDMWIEQEYNK